jgi:signal transduction histidine kinase
VFSGLKTLAHTPKNIAGHGLDHGPSPDLAVLLVNEKGEISAASNEALSLLQLGSRKQALPASLLELVRETVLSGHSLAQEISLGTSAAKNGSLQATVQPLPESSGTRRLAIILSDKKERDLRRLHRLASAGTLSASMAHEIKNALVAGKTFVELLLEKNQDAELVGIVRREMERIDSLVSQMLQFSGPGKARHSAVKVHDILEISLRLIQPQFKTKSIVIKEAFQASSDLVEGDEQQLEQAFVNLLLNSMEAMGQNGQLVVSTQTIRSAQAQKGPVIEITIADNGGGIAPQMLDHLFEPFFTTKQNGTGLGLAITRKIIKEHQGEIRAENNPDEGATFRISMPVAAARR